MVNRTPSVWSVPFPDFAYLQQQLDRLAQETFGLRAQASVATLPIDVHEKADEVVIRAFAPGLRADSIDVQFENGVVTISGSYPQLYDREEMSSCTWHVRELRGGRFQRTITLPGTFDVDHARAEMADGILTLIFPKAPETRPRRLEITSRGHEAESRSLSAGGNSTGANAS